MKHEPRRVFAFAATIAVIAVVWLVGLPRLSRHDSIRERIARERAAGIDPDAMFYTELGAMRGIAERMERRRAAHPGLWWDPGAGGRNDRRGPHRTAGSQP